MAASRTTRKVTIDSARRISSTGDLIEQPAQPTKKKSVFDRLGVSNPKALVSTQLHCSRKAINNQLEGH